MFLTSLLLIVPLGSDASGVEAPARPSLGLEQAWERALRDNPELREARLSLEAARHALKAARGAFDPSLGLGVDTGRTSAQSTNNGTSTNTTGDSSWSAGLDQPLPTGGSVGLTWTESLASSENASLRSTWDTLWLSLDQPLLQDMGPVAARAGVRRGVRDLARQEIAFRRALESALLEVSEAWRRAVLTRESLSLATRSLEVAGAQRDETRARLDEGFAGLNDLLQVERQVGVARQNLVSIQAEAESARLGLCRKMGVALMECPEYELPPPPPLPSEEPTLSSALAQARARNHALQEQGLALEQALDDLRIARWNALPALDLSASLGYAGFAADPRDARSQVLSDAQPSWALGLDLTVPLPGREPIHSVAGVRIAAEQARIRFEAAEQDLEADVREALRDASRDRVRVELARQTEAAAGRALELDQELYKEGRCSSRDVVLSIEGLDSAQASRLSAEASLQASILRLEQVQGVLLGRVGL